MMVSEFLKHGSGNALTGETLAELLGISIRDVTQAIERERRAGFPVCASCDSARPGYFLGDAGELALYLNSLDRRLANIAATRRNLQQTLDRMTGQETVLGWEDE